jgi:tRNA threonylcarbamoyladenosine modification (KEOPS) complex Cgi121 subunit
LIVQEFTFPERNLHYYVGLGSLITNKLKLDDIFGILESIQNQFENCMIQFFNKQLVLNSNHIFYACYHTLRSFQLKANISNKMEIEFLLYLSANRQIRKALKYYGITKENINQGQIVFCVISLTKNLDLIRTEILNLINATENSLNLDEEPIVRYENIKKFFAFNDNQIMTVLKSHGINIYKIIPNRNNILQLNLAIEDLLAEKMVLLSLESTQE